MILRQVVTLGCVVLVMVAAGCVSQQVSKAGAKETVLIVAGAGDSVTLQWQSEPDLIYTVVYTEKLGGVSEWKVLPRAQGVRGTGQMITIQDSAPSARRRYYRLQVHRDGSK